MADRVFFDLDGTLLDSSRRLYTLFMELAPESFFSYEEYWDIKRKKTNQQDLLKKYFNYTNDRVLSFKETWHKRVEDPTLLEMDTPFEGVPAFLERIFHKKKLYVVTARQHPERVETQLDKFGWKPYFVDILVTQQKQSKADLIREHLSPESDDILVGDTGDDILCGKELGVRTVAVCSGNLNADSLKEYKPEQILDSVVQMEPDFDSQKSK